MAMTGADQQVRFMPQINLCKTLTWSIVFNYEIFASECMYNYTITFYSMYTQIKSDLSSKLSKSQKRLGPQITNPQSATFAESLQI